MSERSIDELREELRNLGYLSRGLERWFARDPWTSRTFWAQLMLVTSKASFLLAIFAVLPMAFVLLRRNASIGIGEALVVAALQFGAVFAVTLAVLVCTALVLRVRPALAIESPAALMAIAMTASGLVAVAVGIWWLGFEEWPSPVEAVVFLALLALLFIVGSIVVSAALLSFSIHETHRIPSIHRRSRTLPIAITGAVLFAGLFVPMWLARQRVTNPPPAQVVVAPTEARVALVVVEGMTRDILDARTDLVSMFPRVGMLAPVREASPAAVWATVGTGTPGVIHGVHAVDGIVITGSSRILQATSRFDFVLRNLAPLVGLARRQALPPSVRRREYVWEELAARGVPAVAVNWWASDDVSESGLASVSQETVFRSAAASDPSRDPRAMALAVDRIAIGRLRSLVRGREPRFATVDLPGLDVLLNRISLSDTQRVAASVAALDPIVSVVSALRHDHYDVVLVGLPGTGQGGNGVIAWTLTAPLENARAIDVAPTLLDLFGFPASDEMPGKSLLPDSSQDRIPTYGPRVTSAESHVGDSDYYESLRALGYIQ